MADNPFEMVVWIILIVSIAGVLRARYKTRSDRPALADDPDAAKMKEEILKLRDRVAVLERIATDKNHLLEREFERLRDR